MLKINFWFSLLRLAVVSVASGELVQWLSILLYPVFTGFDILAMRILFADKFPSDQLEKLSSLGYELEYRPDLASESLPREINAFDILVVRSTRVNKDTITAGEQLKLIVRAGAGTNTIDKEYAAERKIPVCNIPGKNAISVAELVFGLLLSIDRKIPDNVRELREGTWNKATYSQAEGVYGKSIGIVGVGAIGIEVAERAHVFGLQVHMIEKSGRSSEVEQRIAPLGVVRVKDLDEMVSKCDVITFHVPSAPGTRHLVNARLLSLMKDGAIIINTSRGDLVDESALVQAMDSKGIRAGLDVYENEPGNLQGKFDSVLAKHPNVYGTHHIGASTSQAQAAVSDGVTHVIEAFKNGKLLNCVNL